ncbi:MAG: hypothetical protein V3U03_10420 [Myxococcota bacterium]
MAVVVTLIGVLVAAVGALASVSPSRLIGWVSALDSTTRFWTAVLVRVVLGILLLVAAPSCRAPLVVQVIGAVTLIAAAALVALGPKRLDAFVAWWLERPKSLVRGSGGFAVGFGALLIYAGA